MRKFDKIKDNILLMQNINSKRIEKDFIETPGPGFYNPSYKHIEENPLAVH